MTNQKSPKDFGTFTATIDDDSFIAKEVTLHNFAGENPGGYISGTQGSREIYIGYPDGIGDDNKVTKKYPADFSDLRMNWSLREHEMTLPAEYGSITVLFLDGMNYAEGEFEFTLKHSGRKVTGKFEVRND